MSVTCVVQARMGSTRLPGKVLADLQGRPLLAFMLARLEPLAVDHVVVATSTLAQDDPVAVVAASAGVEVFRGPEDDVLDRYAGAVTRWPADVVVRLTADCPLTDPAVVEDALALRASSGADYCSNSLVRTFPKGLDVEVLTARALLEAASEATDPAEREHVTPFVYRRPERYRLVALRSDELAGDERWTVDTPADLERVREIAAAVRDPLRAPWREMLAAVGRLADPTRDRPWLRPAVAADAQRIDELGDAPPRPILDHLGDVAVRTWVVDAGEPRRPAGWLQLEVRGGVGRLTGRVRPDLEAEARAELRGRLAQEFQVVELEEDPIPGGLASLS